MYVGFPHLLNPFNLHVSKYGALSLFYFLLTAASALDVNKNIPDHQKRKSLHAVDVWFQHVGRTRTHSLFSSFIPTFSLTLYLERHSF